MLTAARMLAGTVMAAIALTTLGACSQGQHPDLTAAEPPVAQAAGQPSTIPTNSAAAPASAATTATTTTTAPAAGTTAAAKQSAPATQQVPLEPSPLPSLSAVPAVPAAFTEACTPAALLAYVKTQQGPATGFGEVKIYNCVGGYAQLYAMANPAPSGERPEGDQFYVQYSNGQWKTLARGAGIGCGDGTAAIAQACAVFEFAATH